MEGGGSIEANREAPSRSPGLGSNVVVFPPPIEPAGALGLVVHLLMHPSAVFSLLIKIKAFFISVKVIFISSIPF